MTTAFVKLQMFKDQNNKKGYSTPTPPKLENHPAFLEWKVGYVVARKSTPSEPWTISAIKSEDAKMHYQDCEVELVNPAGEKNLLKGTTLQSGYVFLSKGDVKEPEPEVVAPTEKPVRDDCTFIVINVAGIREFYPRKRGEGTRILMQDKTAYIVADDADAVLLQIKQAVAASIAGLCT